MSRIPLFALVVVGTALALWAAVSGAQDDSPTTATDTQVTAYRWMRDDSQFASQEIRLERYGADRIVVTDLLVLAGQDPVWLLTRTIEYRLSAGQWHTTDVRVDGEGNDRVLRGSLICRDGEWRESFVARQESATGAASPRNVERTHAQGDTLLILPEHLSVLAPVFGLGERDTERALVLPLLPRSPWGPLIDGAEPQYELGRAARPNGAGFEIAFRPRRETPRPAVNRQGRARFDEHERLVELVLELEAGGTAKSTAYRILPSTRIDERTWKQQHEPQPEIPEKDK